MSTAPATRHALAARADRYIALCATLEAAGLSPDSDPLATPAQRTAHRARIALTSPAAWPFLSARHQSFVGPVRTPHSTYVANYVRRVAALAAKGLAPSQSAAATAEQRNLMRTRHVLSTRLWPTLSRTEQARVLVTIPDDSLIYGERSSPAALRLHRLHLRATRAANARAAAPGAPSTIGFERRLKNAQHQAASRWTTLTPHEQSAARADMPTGWRPADERETVTTLRLHHLADLLQRLQADDLHPSQDRQATPTQRQAAKTRGELLNAWAALNPEEQQRARTLIPATFINAWLSRAARRVPRQVDGSRPVAEYLIRLAALREQGLEPTSLRTGSDEQRRLSDLRAVLYYRRWAKLSAEDQAQLQAALQADWSPQPARYARPQYKTAGVTAYLARLSALRARGLEPTTRRDGSPEQFVVAQLRARLFHERWPRLQAPERAQLTASLRPEWTPKTIAWTTTVEPLPVVPRLATPRLVDALRANDPTPGVAAET